ncbi:creatininase family protein [Marinobacter nanhaiticus D15-8W]|uniref:Creatininase family protein n=1 Tax=Marinobacter nanhaiticus D15-8W TaxID=626887 RepID=N6WS10_9GAMM|nr:creatininase family protein [Marinobacter nanhaiticus]ENO14331.1 creatininase family protein [Marinobacter nanhaiticus D15-8W]BES71719.1 creatininase family protein [Marinobacter nanhaiticus D15-8W]
MDDTVHYWQDLTTEELADVVGDSTVAILPVAAIEQHGPHLPLSTDLIIGEGILLKALDQLDGASALVLPTVTVGLSLEHTSFSGTLSLRPDTAIDVLVDIGQSVAASGVHRLVIFNSHGGNRQIIDLAALQLRQRFGMLVVKANYFRFKTPSDLVEASELARGIHGGELETAMMLYLARDSVRLEHLQNFEALDDNLLANNEKLGPENEAAFAWMGQDLNPAGVVGRAAQATTSQGEKLVAHFARALATTIREAQQFNLKLLR